jgi:transcriptional regulator with XRE-family HTH domain
VRLSGECAVLSSRHYHDWVYFRIMDDREPTVRSRELGESLRAAMESAGLTGHELGRRLEWAPSRISRLLSGKRGGSDIEIAEFLAVCGAKRTERRRLVELCREVGRPGLLQQHGERLPKQLRTLMDLEDKCIRAADYQAILIPGLLQTRDYARSAMRGTGTLPVDEIEDRVAARCARQEKISYATRYVFFLHEHVLRLPVGDGAVMSDQLHHLLMLSVRPYIEVRVVPVAHGAHAAVAGSFKFMEFAEFNPVVYLESETTALFLEETAEITAYRRILDSLAETALGEGQSRELIARLAIELYGHREDHDAGLAQEQLQR